MSQKPDPFGNSTSIDRTKARRDFLQLSEDDIQELHEMRPLFENYAEQFVEQFYQHLFQFEESSKYLQDEELVSRLKKFQQHHFKTMFDAQWGEQYDNQRRKVGQAHAEIGIDPELFLGAYNLYLQFFLGRLNQDYQERKDSEKKFRVLLKATIYDIGLTLDAYFAHSTQQIRKALDLYWQANTELRQFAELTSHDLKTPLATVANLCDEVIDEFGEEMPTEAVHLIEKASQRTFDMSRLIDALLASTKIDTGEDSIETVDLSTILRRLKNHFHFELEKKKIQLIIQGSLPNVTGNASRLQEAISNIISNAIKFTERANGRINVSSRIVDGRQLELIIKDNGTGIPQNELKRIFVPFRRLPNHQDVPGSGLGLYFTKQIIESAGGKIWAESDLNEGATFHLLLNISESSSQIGLPN